MKAETVLDSVMFQLTPTRTRYDLVIIANGKTEKIASGLLDPFLAHLKSAKDQIAKGGYSIRLEPDPGTETAWFTKDIVERFVRYVSTPEVLERVNTLELEILQINEAIAIQGNGALCSSIVEDHQCRWTGSGKGSRSIHISSKEKVMVLSKHGKHRRLSTGSITHEANSRHQLLEVHESRKTALRKEQGMAFARAVAAGFDMDHMANLILFAQSFGASRLLEACTRFVDLWKGKHQNEQWAEVVGAESVPFKSEFASINASGIIFSGDDWKEKHFIKTWPLSGDNLVTDNNNKDCHATSSNIEEKRLSSDPQCCRGQIQNPMLPQWASHLPPVSQSYPLQGMSYCEKYPANVSAFQSSYPPTYDLGLSIKTGFRSNSVDKVYHNELNSQNMDVSKDEVDQNDIELKKRTSQGRESCKKAGRSGKRRSSAVVEKHITSSGSESQSPSDADSQEEIQEFRSDTMSRKHRKSSSMIKESGVSMPTKTSNTSKEDQVVDRPDGDVGNWQAFQKLLLRVQSESASTADRDMFSGENPRGVRRLNKSPADPSIHPSRNSADVQELRMAGCDNEGERSGYHRAKNDDFIISEPMKKVSSKRSSRMLSQNEYKSISNFRKSSAYNVSDESIIPFQSRLHSEAAEDNRTATDMDYDFHSAQKNNRYCLGTKDQRSYEPHDLNLMPERELEKGCSAFDPAKDFDMQIHVQNSIKRETRSQEDVSKRAREGLKGSGKERNSNSAHSGLEKRKVDPMTTKGKSPTLNLLADAKARADKLRAFKADLQKAKKEKEEEEIKRLEALKKERQKRIAARSSLKGVQSAVDAPSTKARKPTRNSPSSHNGIKSCDTKPISSSLLHKTPRNSTSPLKTHQVAVSITPKPSPCSYKGSKFSDAQPASSSPLVKLLRSRSFSQSTYKSQETAVEKQRRLSPSSAPVKLPSNSKLLSQLTSKPMETAAQKPMRLYASTVRRSKFADIEPSSSSSLQKLRTRTMSAGSLDPHEMTKPNRLNGSAHLVKTGSRQSVSPVSGLKKELSGPSVRANAVHIQAKRLSSSSGNKMHSPSSVRSVTSNQVQKQTVPKKSQEKSMPATLHGRIAASTEPCGEVHMNACVKERRYETGVKTLSTSDKLALAFNNNEDDPIVEKAVLILENKRMCGPMGEIRVGSCEVGTRERIELVSDHQAVLLATTSLVEGEVHHSSRCKPDVQQRSNEGSNPSKNTCQKLSQAPFARTLHVEEPSSSEIEQVEEHADWRKAAVGSQRTTRASRSVDSISVERINELHEKPHSRGSPKGFKELLKFRRKGQSSASKEFNIDSSVVDVCLEAAASNNVPTLEDLFSKDSNAMDTPPKVSRPFSLFSPFQTKNSEKKREREEHA